MKNMTAVTGHKIAGASEEIAVKPARGCSEATVAQGNPQAASAVVRKLAVPLSLLALTGCAHTPLITSCITPQQYQQLESQRPPKVHDKLTGQADKDVRPLAGSIIEHRAYEDVLLGTLKVCAGLDSHRAGQ